MNKVALITVEDTFYIKGFGLVLSPSLKIPSNVAWKKINEIVDIQHPDGSHTPEKALFDIAHINTKNSSMNIGKHRTVLLSLKDADKHTVPIGSIVHVSNSTKQILIDAGLESANE